MATFAAPYSVNPNIFGALPYIIDSQEPLPDSNGFYEGIDGMDHPFQSFLSGGLDLPLSNDFYTAPQRQLNSSEGARSETPNMQAANRPAMSASSGSAASASSSMVGSPTMSEQYMLHSAAQGLMFPDITSMNPSTSFINLDGALGFVQPGANLLDPAFAQQSPLTPVGNHLSHFVPRQHTNPTSPALSIGSNHGPSRTGPTYTKASRGNSPYQQSRGWTPYPQGTEMRRASAVSFGQSSPGSGNQDFEDGEKEKNRCPFPDCGKVFKDLKAHMLTHQNERPEKCPITSCEYNKKGFSRKYDKNRHTLTHYKGTMVCGFCPGSGSAAEKSFNRADVFKRHLMSVHGVEQNPPNSRKKAAAPSGKASNSASDATGKCSICNGIFSTPQQFYEHLEDCVLSVVQNIEPSEAINEQLLTTMADDDAVQETMDRHHLPNTLDLMYSQPTHSNGDDDDDERDSDSEPRDSL